MISPNRAIYLINVLIVLLFWSNKAFAQKDRTNHWKFATHNSFDFSNTNPVTGSCIPNITGGSSTMSDSSGNLLLFSNGLNVYDADDNIMPNGSGMLGSISSSQTSMIVPKPNTSNNYFLFTVSSLANGNGFNAFEIDMTLNSGLGDVVANSQLHLIDSIAEKVCATKHTNDIDYWVVAHRWESNEFYAFHVSETGVNPTPVISSIGVFHTSALYSGEPTGQMKFSPDGTKIATANFGSGVVQLYDFDNETGVISNMLELTPGIISQFPYGIAFSADSKKFYYGRRVSNGIDPVGIHQFDLDHINIDCLLASEVEFANVSPFKLISDLQLAPNKKIYVTYYGQPPVSQIGTIHSPEKRCLSCDFENIAVTLNSNSHNGLTNFASSFLSDGIRYEFGSNCLLDTTFFWPDDTFRLDSVKWNFDDPSSGILNTSSSIYAQHYYAAADTYNVQLIAYRGNRIDTFYRNTVIWNVTDNLLGSDTTICQGNDLTLSASWYNSCFEWYDGTSPTYKTVNQTGWYWLDIWYQPCYFRDSIYIEVVNDIPDLDLGPDTTICLGDSFTFDPAFQLAGYTWSNGSHDTIYKAFDTDTVWLTLSNACGDTTDTALVGLKPGLPPTLNLPNDTTICDTTSFTLDVTATGTASYTWENGNSSPIRSFSTEGIYWIEVTNECGTKSDSMQLNNEFLLESALIESALFCGKNDSILLEALVDGSDALWNTGELSSSIYAISGGPFWFEASNLCGTFSDTIFIEAFDTNFAFSLPKDSFECSLSAPFEIGYLDTNFAFNYSWNTGKNGSYETVDQTGLYVLTLKNKCINLSDSFVYQNAEPLGIIAPETRSLCDINPIQLLPSSFAFDSLSWNRISTENQFLARNKGIVQLEIFDTNGCYFIDTIMLSANCQTQVSISNVFTPNADGMNDTWCPELSFGKLIGLYVYNRWGTEVYSTQNQSFCWDGYINGELAKSGTYFYVFILENENAEVKEFRGTVTVLD
ncbi:MAG: gliding motility-associated C-terminal domain-containing protein [Salibacteraceae bacterium]|nr:gliding motility-associated C-terminal domain-containing protein [Salibacteraceae bacterium]